MIKWFDAETTIRQIKEKRITKVMLRTALFSKRCGFCVKSRCLIRILKTKVHGVSIELLSL